MGDNLDTTNVLLGIMAAVSVLEALLMIGLGVAVWKVYRRSMTAMADLESRHLAPLLGRVNRLLDDVQAVTATVKDETERVDDAISRTIDRVDDTARRMRSRVVAKTSRLVGFVRGARVAIESLLSDDVRDASMKART